MKKIFYFLLIAFIFISLTTLSSCTDRRAENNVECLNTNATATAMNHSKHYTLAKAQKKKLSDLGKLDEFLSATCRQKHLMYYEHIYMTREQVEQRYATIRERHK